MNKFQAIESIQRILSKNPQKRFRQMMTQIRDLQDGEIPEELANEIKFSEFETYSRNRKGGHK